MEYVTSFRDSALKATDSFRGIERTDSQDSSALDEITEGCPQLSYRQRVAGFALFFATGYFVTFGSFKHFIGLMEGNPVPFVLTYSLGNLCSLLASLFLVGPHRQLANMFDETRKVTTIVFLASLFLVLVLCFVNMENILKLTLLVTLVLVQFFASLWYSLSYIPFARNTVVKIGREKFGYADESFV